MGYNRFPAKPPVNNNTPSNRTARLLRRQQLRQPPQSTNIAIPARDSGPHPNRVPHSTNTTITSSIPQHHIHVFSLPMDNRTDLPRLDPSNYGPWLVALRAAAYASESHDNLTGNPTVPAADPEATLFNKKKHYLLGKIISSIPPDIANLLLTPTSDPTPYDLVEQIKTHLDTSNANDHKYLKQLGEDTHFQPGHSLQEYVGEHEKIRARMIAAQFPDISDPKTTVEFMIDGLKHNPFTAHIGLQLLALNPIDVKDFIHKYNRIFSYQAASSQYTAPPHGLPPTKHTKPPRRYDKPRSQNPGNRNNRQAHGDFKPCKFHIQKGLPAPRHTDEECNGPEHPRNRTNRAATGHTRFAQFELPPQYAPHTLPPLENNNHEPSDDSAGTSILDSGSHPSHTKKPSTEMRPLSYPLHTITATNDKSLCTHAGQMRVKTNRNATLKLPSVVNPDISHNLLSVHDIALRYGDVMFTANKAFILKPIANGKRKTIGTAPWNPTLRAYSWNLTPPHSRAARSTPVPRKMAQVDKTSNSNTNKPPPHTPVHVSQTACRTPYSKIPPRHTTLISHQIGPRDPHPEKPSPAQIAFSTWHLRLNHTPCELSNP